jgi:integrase
MCRLQNVTRKDGVYYFRRLIRIGADKPFRLRLSLRTTCRQRAAVMAPALTTACIRIVMRLMASPEHDGLTEAQRAEIFRRQVLIERDRLEIMQARLHIIPPEDHDDLEQALALRLDASELAAMDGVAKGRVEDFLFADFDPDDDNAPIIVKAWSDLAASIEQDGAEEAAVARLTDLGIERSALREIMARKVVNAARVDAIRRFRDALANPGLSYATVPVPAYNQASLPPAFQGTTEEPMIAGPWATMTATEAAQKFFAQNPRTGGADGTRSRRGEEAWTAKTRQQFELSALLLEQVMRGGPLATITHDDLVDLDDCFSKLHGPTFRKSPQHRDMTIWEIVAETAEKVAESEKLSRREARQASGKSSEQKLPAKIITKADLGLGLTTTNRHWGFLQQLTTWFNKRQPLSELDYKALVIKRGRNPRDMRDRYTVDQGQMIFSLPPWSGSKSYLHRMQLGSVLVHDAWYFVPLIAWYTGMRRDEICGLKLDDIEQVGEMWVFNVRPNDVRRLKTISSARKIPFAKELIRLKLPDYVAAMREAGETLLFPELVPESGKGVMGDRYHKIVWTKLASELPFLKTGQATHAFRHTAIDSMKGAGISAEIRADFAGHRMANETEGRYSKAHLDLLKIAVDVIPEVSKQLDPFSVTILPARLRGPRKSRSSKTSAIAAVSPN